MTKGLRFTQACRVACRQDCRGDQQREGTASAGKKGRKSTIPASHENLEISTLKGCRLPFTVHPGLDLGLCPLAPSVMGLILAPGSPGLGGSASPPPSAEVQKPSRHEMCPGPHTGCSAP